MIYMSDIIKIKRIKEIAHKNGIKKLSTNAINKIDEAINRLIDKLFHDCNIVFDGKLIESIHLEKLCSLENQYIMHVKTDELNDIDINDIIKDMPINIDEDDEEN